jgi:type IV pilus assembly protein PilV
MKTSTKLSYRQRGVMLLEALIAILIFSMGILAIVGLQVNSIKLSNDSKYRGDASLVVNRYIGQMWMNHNSLTFAADFQTGGAAFNAWVASDVATTLNIQGVTPPSVVIAQSSVMAAQSAVTGNSVVEIKVHWNIPGEAGTGVSEHTYTTRAQITN